MVECNKCLTWYHGSCVGITKKRGNARNCYELAQWIDSFERVYLPHNGGYFHNFVLAPISAKTKTSSSWDCSVCTRLENVVVKPLQVILQNIQVSWLIIYVSTFCYQYLWHFLTPYSHGLRHTYLELRAQNLWQLRRKLQLFNLLTCKSLHYLLFFIVPFCCTIFFPHSTFQNRISGLEEEITSLENVLKEKDAALKEKTESLEIVHQEKVDALEKEFKFVVDDYKDNIARLKEEIKSLEDCNRSAQMCVYIRLEHSFVRCALCGTISLYA